MLASRKSIHFGLYFGVYSMLGCWKICPKVNRQSIDSCAHFIIIYKLFNNKNYLAYLS